jgi:hypothetical protein
MNLSIGSVLGEGFLLVFVFIEEPHVGDGGVLLVHPLLLEHVPRVDQLHLQLLDLGLQHSDVVEVVGYC